MGEGERSANSVMFVKMHISAWGMIKINLEYYSPNITLDLTTKTQHFYVRNLNSCGQSQSSLMWHFNYHLMLPRLDLLLRWFGTTLIQQITHILKLVVNNLVRIMIGNIQVLGGYRWFKFVTKSIGLTVCFDGGCNPFGWEDVIVGFEVFNACVADDILNLYSDGVGIDDIVGRGSIILAED